jgi:hypothetical protein
LASIREHGIIYANLVLVEENLDHLPSYSLYTGLLGNSALLEKL